MILKYRASILLLLFVISCTSTKEDTNTVEKDVTKPLIQLANDDNTNIFLNRLFRDQLKFFEEQTMPDYVSTKKPKQFIRFTLLPSHSRNSTIRVTQLGKKSELVFKGTDYDELTTIMKSNIDEKVLDSLNYYIEQSDFWELNNLNTQCNEADGAIFIIEASMEGKTNTLLRWSPGACKLGNGDAILKLSSYLLSLVDLRTPGDLSTY